VLEVASGLIIDEGAVAEEVYILAVVLLLGVLTSLIYVSGGLGDHVGQDAGAGPAGPGRRGLVIFFDWIIIGGPADVPCRLHPRRRAVRVCEEIEYGEPSHDGEPF
jgi:hypothetical protein